MNKHPLDAIVLKVGTMIPGIGTETDIKSDRADLALLPDLGVVEIAPKGLAPHWLPLGDVRRMSPTLVVIEFKKDLAPPGGHTARDTGNKPATVASPKDRDMADHATVAGPGGAIVSAERANVELSAGAAGVAAGRSRKPKSS